MLPLREEGDLVRMRQRLRVLTGQLQYGLVDQTKLITAASELGRNALVHGGGGQVRVSRVEQDHRVGLRLVFTDEGPGIPDIERALTDGFTTGSGLGLGLGGSRRLVDSFEVQSTPGRGTTVTILRWSAH